MAQDNTPRKSGILPTPAYRSRADYRGLVAPYTSFRPSPFYSTVAHGGTFTGDIWGCPWNCVRCWSRSGHRDEPVKLECSPSLVVDKFVAGMERNLMAGCRISGGDVGYWWDHVRAVIDEFLNRTHSKRLRFANGQTFRERMRLVLETSGGITITPQQLLDIEAVHGDRAKGLVLSIGMKATNPQLLADLTGMPIRAATAAHERQLALVRAACQLEHVQTLVSFLKPYAPEGEFEALRSEFDEMSPGLAEAMARLRMRHY